MRDPKQWAKVPVCLKREIVAAMGGQNSDLYEHFRKLAVEAYMILRKHAATFLTLLSCMAGSAIECFTGDSSAVSLEFAISQVRSIAVHIFSPQCPHAQERRQILCFCTMQMEERFKMEVSDDVARTHIFALIDQSIANMFAPMGDTAHRIAANFRP
jgi:phosphatidylinositol kinase/protein kinase (PI-3  family)